ncbi:MAG: hypothetical protein QXU89_01820 [Desulfurococcaceae archaeon]
MVSKFYMSFLKEILESEENFNECRSIIRNAFELSTHLVRVRSVARAAGFCAFYGRMAEKMGVYEVLESNSIVKGRDVHRILSLASLNFFIDNPSLDPYRDSAKVESLIGQSIRKASEELEEVFEIKNETLEVAKTLLKRLVMALPKAKHLLGLKSDEPLFPIVEQLFADYSTRIFGSPDLILENRKENKAIVVEWKTYTPIYGEGRKSRYLSVSEFEIAQVIAYSIIEAKRLGIHKIKDIFESISGIEHKLAKQIVKNIKAQSKSAENPGLININIDMVRTKIKVLPMIVTPSGSYPPHPFMYKDCYNRLYERFAKLYTRFIAVIVAAEHLALQIMNIPDLIKSVTGYMKSDINSICKTKDGYLAYSLTPFKYLRRGKPGYWDKYPCKLCGFKGDDGPCEFYFGKRKPKDYFDKLMWWARYVVYSKREKDLVNHRAMYEIFKSSLVKEKIFNLKDPIRIVVDLSHMPGTRVKLKESRSKPVVNTVEVKRGSQDLGKFRFDYFKISDVTYDKYNNVIELRRELRDIEKEKMIVGCLRKSISLSILEPGRELNPLTSINTFVMIEKDASVNEDGYIIYRCYSPSPVLMLNFMIFGKYIEIFNKMNYTDAIVLAYETPVDLTIMELRAIDALHRYLKNVEREPGRIVNELKQYGIEDLKEEDLVKESNHIKNHASRDENVLGVTASYLSKLLRKRILKTGGDVE